MKLRVITSSVNVRKKRVLLRCDLNITLASGAFEPSDIWKLKSLLPTIEYLIKRGAAVILVSHRGRPKGYDHDLSLEPIAGKLSRMLKKNILFWHDDMDGYERRARMLARDQIACLENIRFSRFEQKNDSHFAQQLARLADVYVNDAFASIHREHASTVAITRYLPPYAGLLMQREVKNLYGLISRTARPIVAIVGGSKISTKIRLLKKLLRRVDYLLLGGALANNVLAAMSHEVGKSKVESDMIAWSKGLLSNKLRVPVDARVSRSLAAPPRITAVGRVKPQDIILDLGPDTIALYESIIQIARTIIWNGPLGYFEDKRYSQATNDLIRILTRVKAKSYVGGGETVKAVLAQHAADKLHFISTGGGAMLELIEGRPLPALRPLMLRR